MNFRSRNTDAGAHVVILDVVAAQGSSTERINREDGGWEDARQAQLRSRRVPAIGII